MGQAKLRKAEILRLKALNNARRTPSERDALSHFTNVTGVDYDIPIKALTFKVNGKVLTFNTQPYTTDNPASVVKHIMAMVSMLGMDPNNLYSHEVVARAMLSKIIKQGHWEEHQGFRSMVMFLADLGKTDIVA